MNWNCLALAALVGMGVGCSSPHTLLESGHPFALPSSDAVSSAPPLARSQKPDAETGVRPAAANVPENSGVLATAPVDTRVACRIRALVDGVAILDDELRQATYQYLQEVKNLSEPERSVRMNEVIRRELDKLIERELIMNEATARLQGKKQTWDKLKEVAGKEFDKQLRSMRQRAAAQGFPCESDEQFKELLALQGLTLEGLQRQSERSFMSMEFMRHRIFPLIEQIGHKQIRQYYDEHPGEFQAEDRVKWQDIFIDASQHPNREAARRFAEEIARRVAAGDDFAQLCQQHDNGDSKGRKGEGYGQKRGEIRPEEAEPYLFRMREGEVGPIIEMVTGFHVIRLSERQYAGLVPFDEKTQGQIKKRLQNIIMEREYRRIVDDMKRRASVQILDTDP